MIACKQTEEGILSVSNNSISLDTTLTVDDHYNRENGYKPTTKKVFDNMFNEAMSTLKNLGNGKV